MSEKRTTHTTVGAVPTAMADEAQIVALMVEDTLALREGSLDAPKNVFDTNGQAISMFATNKEYAESLRGADLVHADGQFIVWMSKLKPSQQVPERTATTDLIHSASEAAAQHGIKFYLLGGNEEINRKCAEVLRHQYPNLQIVGRRNGYFSQADEQEVIDDINSSGAEVVWVGLGKPKEQFFCTRVRDRLNCAWLITCGGCFHFIVGDYKRAPEWLQKAGLEWMHRMATGPRYLLMRYLVTIPHAIGLVLFHDIIRYRIGKKDV